MPPKRARASKTSNQQKQATTKRTSLRRVAKPHIHASDAEILRAFRLFALPLNQFIQNDEDTNAYGLSDDDNHAEEQGFLSLPDVRRCLTALSLPKPPAGFFDADQKFLRFSEFLMLAQTLRESAEEGAGSEGEEDGGEDDGEQREIDKAYTLFTRGHTGDTRPITLGDLKRVARELREDVDESVLRMMIEEANGHTGADALRRGVGRREFEEVMKRAGVFG